VLLVTPGPARARGTTAAYEQAMEGVAARPWNGLMGVCTAAEPCTVVPDPAEKLKHDAAF